MIFNPGSIKRLIGNPGDENYPGATTFLPSIDRSLIPDHSWSAWLPGTQGSHDILSFASRFKRRITRRYCYYYFGSSKLVSWANWFDGSKKRNSVSRLDSRANRWTVERLRMAGHVNAAVKRAIIVSC